MRALVLERHSGPFILTEAELPTITVGQVLVRIKASGVNPLDTKIRTGNAAHARVELPAILGMDLAGVVEAVGADVTAFKPVQSLNRGLRRSADQRMMFSCRSRSSSAAYRQL
jgi:NADPH2:quinone reductase